MHKPIPVEVVSIDGGAKTSKSTVSAAIARALEGRVSVKFADAGAFYRRVTVASFDVLGVDGRSKIADHDLDAAIAQALRDGTPFDDNYDWGNLERPTVGKWVSVVGRRSNVQQAAMEWYAKIIEQARGYDVLVINARNPRSHMEKWLRNGTLHISLELFTDCDAAVAAKRKLLSHGIAAPTAEELEQERLAILARRDLDLTRPTDTFIIPDQLVSFKLGDNPAKVIAKARTGDAASVPLPILFDTSAMSKAQMEQIAQELALAALGLATS